jgi:hypothetical protein
MRCARCHLMCGRSCGPGPWCDERLTQLLLLRGALQSLLDAAASAAKQLTEQAVPGFAPPRHWCDACVVSVLGPAVRNTAPQTCKGGKGE